MARKGAVLAGKEAIPTLELFKGIKHTTVDVDTAVEQLPNTNLSHRKAIFIQNKHASNTLYIGGGMPYVIIGDKSDTHEEHDYRGYEWFLSSSGTNEWYLASYDSSTGTKTAPSGMSQVTYLYYATIGGSETLGTEGTVGSLGSEHNWGWGTTSDVTGNTLFIRTNGSASGNSPEYRYELLHAYYFTLTADDTAGTGGIEITSGNAISFTLDGSVRVFGIGSAANTATGVIEFY